MTSALVGRAAQERRLRELVASGVPVVVTGPAGIGKSALVQHALDGMPWVKGSALASLTWSRYVPLSQVTRTALSGEPEEVAATLLAAAGGRVLVLEDLQWADAGTRDVLAVLAHRLPIVATARTGSSGIVDSPALAAVLAAMDATTLALPPLTARSARAVAARRHPGLARPAIDQLLDAAGGVPLLLEQLPVLGVVSPTLHTALTARLESVPDDIRHSLLMLALARHPLPDAVVPGARDHPAIAGLVRSSEGDVELAHAALGDAVLAVSTPGQHAAAHLALAGHLEDPVLRAGHLLAAGRPMTASRVTDEALSEDLEPARRAELLRVVAESGFDPTGRARREAATILLDLGAWDEAVSIAIGGDALTADQRGEAHLIAALAHWEAGRRADSVAHLEAVLEIVAPPAPIAVRAHIELAHQSGRTNPGPESVAAAQAALAVAESTGVEHWRARSVLGQALMLSNQPGWEDLLRGVIDDARAEGDGHVARGAAFTLASGLGFAGQLRAANDLCREEMARLEQQSFGTWHAHFAAALAMNTMLIGEQRGVVVDMARQLVLQRPLFRNRAQVDVALVVALVDDGRSAEAETALGDAWRVARGDEDRSLLLVGEAELGWATGDAERVRRAAAEVDALAGQWFGVGAVAQSLAAYVGLDESGGLPSRSPRPSLPALAPVVIEHAAFEAWNRGDVGTALAAFDAAVAGWTDVHLHRFAARARWARAEVAVRARHPDARRWARDATAGAARLRLAPVQARAERTMARACAVHPSLSVRERDVLALVASGLSSRAIAADLGIAISTVESHLRSARQKLGARTRWQAASTMGAPLSLVR